VLSLLAFLAVAWLALPLIVALYLLVAWLREAPATSPAEPAE
jgi:hypothetical protein